MNQSESQQKIASALCNNIIQQYNVASLAFPDAGERTALAMSVAMVGITAACSGLAKYGNKVPTTDQLLFTSLLIHNSVEFQRDDVLAVGFAYENILKTLDQFREITGRSCEGTLNPSLLEALADWKKKNNATFPDGLQQFRPQ